MKEQKCRCSGTTPILAAICLAVNRKKHEGKSTKQGRNVLESEATALSAQPVGNIIKGYVRLFLDLDERGSDLRDRRRNCPKYSHAILLNAAFEDG
jgi:hypothetical protein